MPPPASPQHFDQRSVADDEELPEEPPALVLIGIAAAAVVVLAAALVLGVKCAQRARATRAPPTYRSSAEPEMPTLTDATSKRAYDDELGAELRRRAQAKSSSRRYSKADRKAADGASVEIMLEVAEHAKPPTPRAWPAEDDERPSGDSLRNDEVAMAHLGRGGNGMTRFV